MIKSLQICILNDGFYCLLSSNITCFKNEGNHDDPELLLAIKAGNHKAFKTFFKNHYAFLYHFLLKKGMSEQQSEDLVQQAFILIWEKRSKINVKKSLRPRICLKLHTLEC